ARFGLSQEEAHREVLCIARIVRRWRERFAACRVSAKDLEYIAPAMLPPSFLAEAAPEPVD
ncbi:MAG: type II toxin-antitoxin system HipA family toxin, partial [Steroidobacteraceae bacterium]